MPLPIGVDSAPPKLKTSFFRRNVQVPVDLSIFSIPPSQPLVGLLEMAAVELDGSVLVSIIMVVVYVQTLSQHSRDLDVRFAKCNASRGQPLPLSWQLVFPTQEIPHLWSSVLLQCQ